MYPGHSTCYFEDLNPEEHLDLTYMIESSEGEMVLDFWVIAPGQRVTHTALREATGSHSFIADRQGRYQYCFSNKNYNAAKKMTFSSYGPEERRNRWQEAAEQMQQELSEEAKKLDEEIMQLVENVRMVKDEQAYMVGRAATHRKTAESTNSRVLGWSLAQVALLFAVCAWQVWYLRSFFEVKRV
ncbi:p24 complex component [Gonapodya sp. JEL0774]|nr:p24 complex component [Gonapodya sp. JEL0774]